VACALLQEQAAANAKLFKQDGRAVCRSVGLCSDLLLAAVDGQCQYSGTYTANVAPSERVALGGEPGKCPGEVPGKFH